jgi:hypothetical protein
MQDTTINSSVAAVQAPRDATLAAVRSELEESGRRLAAIRSDETAELDRIAVLAEIGTGCGLSLSEIAEKAGVSRRTLTTARTAGRGDLERHLHVDVRVAVALGGPHAMSREALVDQVASGPVRPHEVDAALQRLIDVGEARIIGTGVSGAKPVTYFRLTMAGAVALAGRLRRASMSPAREWVIYIRSTEQEAHQIVAQADLKLGRYAASVIPAGTRHDMPVPEVAWRVEASTSQAAIDEAVELMRSVRRQLGSSADPVVVALVAPAPRDGHPGAF